MPERSHHILLLVRATHEYLRHLFTLRLLPHPARLIRLSSGALGLRQPGAPARALQLFLLGDGLDEGTDAAEDRVDASALLLEDGNDVHVTAATRLYFAAVEHSERETAVTAQALDKGKAVVH